MSSVARQTQPNQISPCYSSSFRDWLAEQAAEKAARQDAWSVWLAHKLYELAGEADFLGASNPLEFDARHDAVMREVMR